MKPGRAFIGVGLLLAALSLVPLSRAVAIKGTAYSSLRGPLLFSRNLAQAFLDLIHFQKNADELRALKEPRDNQSPLDFQVQALRLENDRLNHLLEMRRALSTGTEKMVHARVIARSPSAWNRVFLIDKGVAQGIRVNMPVLSDGALIGKIIETGPSVSKVLLVTDPNSRIGAIVQRTRHQGILYGTFRGECRLKYLSQDAILSRGDTVESAGYGGFFPKGLLIGKIEKIWKEPGQIYLVAQVKTATDLSRVEEVACLV